MPDWELRLEEMSVWGEICASFILNANRLENQDAFSVSLQTNKINLHQLVAGSLETAVNKYY